MRSYNGVVQMQQQEVELSLIDTNPFQNRTLESRLQVEDLARSMARHGLLAPIVVYRKPDGRFGLVAGERRLRAARTLPKGLQTPQVGPGRPA